VHAGWSIVEAVSTLIQHAHFQNYPRESASIQVRSPDAREIHNWFIEGFDPADLKEAKALLDELTVD
jgi:hypothetical protein